MAGSQLEDDSATDAAARTAARSHARAQPAPASWQAEKFIETLGGGVKTLAKTCGDLFVYGALRAVWGLLHGLSAQRARGVLESIGAAVGHVDRHHRRVVADNLAVAFPHWDARTRARVVEASFCNWGRLAAEVIHVQALIDAAPEEQWREAASAVAAAAAARNRGLLVLTAHTANFEVLARTWCARIGPLAVFHRNFGNPYVDGFLRSARQAAHMATIGRGVSVRDSLRLLAGGTSIAVALDQNQRPGHGVFVEMFGRAACTSTILARLSLATATPVLPVFAVWQGNALVPLVGRLIEPPQRLRGEARADAITALTQRYTAEIEAVVRKHPEQWNWAHRRWKTRPEAEAGVVANARG